MRRWLAVTCGSIALLSALHASSAASIWPRDPALVWPASTLGPRALDPVVVPDGSGGAFVVWSQRIGSEEDIVAQHFRSDGSRAPGWPATGVTVCGATGDQIHPVAVADGLGGTYVAWEDARTPAQGTNVWVQRITGAGVSASGWAANGVLLSAQSGDEQKLSIVTDGNGAFVAWERIASPGVDHDIFAGRVSPFGSAGFSGPVHNTSGVQRDPGAIADGAGGVILAWLDDATSRVLAQRLDASGQALWNAAHVAVRTGVVSPQGTQVVTDGAGGAIVSWVEPDVSYGGPQRAQHLSAAGSVLWSGGIVTGNEVAVVAFPFARPLMQLAADGVGGYFVAFLGKTGGGQVPVRVSRHLPNGLLAPGWPLGGVQVMPSAYVPFSNSSPPVVQSDGTGGVFVAAAAVNGAGSGTEIRSLRLTMHGGVAPGWVTGALAVGIGNILPADAAMASLSDGSVVIAWETQDDATPSLVQANRVDRFGVLGNPAPALVSVRDVAEDQGGSIRVSWAASDLDAEPDMAIGSYRVWKQVPALAATRARTPACAPTDPDLAPGDVIAMSEASVTAYWELVDTQVAQMLPGYSMTVATSGDSTADNPVRTLVMVSALHVSGAIAWNSAPDSGYSVDNVPPPSPTPFTGVFEAGTMALHWGPSPAPDFHAFRVYRGTTPNFGLSGIGFVEETTDTGTVDIAGIPYYYAIVAVDEHGNLSAPSYLSPASVLSAGRLAGGTLSLSAPRPNPSEGIARLAFTLPAAGTTRVCVHDLQGRLVRVLTDGALVAGAHETSWDGTDVNGTPVRAGVFLVRLESGGRVLESRIVRMR